MESQPFIDEPTSVDDAIYQISQLTGANLDKSGLLTMSIDDISRLTEEEIHKLISVISACGESIESRVLIEDVISGSAESLASHHEELAEPVISDLKLGFDTVIIVTPLYGSKSDCLAKGIQEIYQPSEGGVMLKMVYDDEHELYIMPSSDGLVHCANEAYQRSVNWGYELAINTPFTYEEWLRSLTTIKDEDEYFVVYAYDSGIVDHLKAYLDYLGVAKQGYLMQESILGKAHFKYIRQELSS